MIMALNYPHCSWVFEEWYLNWFNRLFNTTDAEAILTDSFGPCDEKFSKYLSNTFVYSLIALYCVIIPIGFFGNLSVIWVIISTTSLHKTLNFLLLSLAVSDLILTVSLPWTLIFNISYHYPYGDGLCRSIPPIQGTAVMSAIYALLFMAVERHQVILYPTQNRIFQSKLRIGILILTLWILCFCFQIPQIVVLDDYVWNQTDEVLEHRVYYQLTMNVCAETWSHVQALIYSLAALIFIYVAPLILLFILYWRIGYFVWFRPTPGDAVSAASTERVQSQRRRLLLMLLLLVSAFALCWGPYFVLIPICLGGDCNPQLAPYFQWLGHANVALDPILYAFLHVKVRKQFIIKVRRLKRQVSVWIFENKPRRRKGLRQTETVVVAFASDDLIQQLNSPVLMRNYQQASRPNSPVCSAELQTITALPSDNVNEMSTSFTAVNNQYSKHKKSVTFENKLNLPGMTEVVLR